MSSIYCHFSPQTHTHTSAHKFFEFSFSDVPGNVSVVVSETAKTIGSALTKKPTWSSASAYMLVYRRVQPGDVSNIYIYMVTPPPLRGGERGKGVHSPSPLPLERRIEISL